jgi:ribosome-associated protein
MTTPESESDTQAPAGFRFVEISSEPIELYKILKFEGMATSGGEAKAVIASGQVLVNGELETQKRKKIVSGNTIEFNDDKICIKLLSPIIAKADLRAKADLPEKIVADESTTPQAQGSEKE